MIAGRWTHAEHEMFVKGLEAHSKQWKLIAELIKTRTVVQVRTHAQKYFQKLLKQSKNDGTNINEEAFADMFNESSADVSPALQTNNSTSNLSLSCHVCLEQRNLNINLTSALLSINRTAFRRTKAKEQQHVSDQKQSQENGQHVIHEYGDLL